MSISLNQISPEILLLIEDQARSLGLSPDEYLRRLLPVAEKELALAPDASDQEFEADMLAFAESTGDRPSYSGTYSREEIYVDHD